MPNPFRTSNPALNEKAFQNAANIGIGEAMTVQGTVNKTGVLLLCVIATSAWTWGLSHSPAARNRHALDDRRPFRRISSPLLPPSSSQTGRRSPRRSMRCSKDSSSAASPPFSTSPYPGIAFHAIGLTFGVLAVMLLAYKTGTIRATQNFRLGVIAATGGIALFYLAEMVLGFFHIAVPAINGSGIIGIGFSLFVVVIASLNLVLDFDMIETGARMNAPRYMEWYGAFGLMVTLVWLYLEMLRLLSKLQRRN